MLPYLAASGHNLYTKSVWIHLERMSNLEKEHPDNYQSFMRGMHAVGRSDRFWAGLSTDLIIEQVLESQNIRWLDKGHWIQGNTEKYMAIFEIYLHCS